MLGIIVGLLALSAAHDCFNCANGGECIHFGTCNNYTGSCDCPPGFGGADCKQPVCGGLSQGDKRPVRAVNETCDCIDGWGGVNCNMCVNDAACKPFVPSPEPGSDGGARCYGGGELVNTNYHWCTVTNRKVQDVLAGRVAQVSFGCAREPATCDLQFWVDEVESFFCKFDTCEFDGLQYNCEHIQCECQPDELLCGKEGSIDISEWLQKSVHGPGDLACDSSGKCTFQEPAMNQLIQFVFGDHSIELQCDSSECLHYSQIPGYEPPQNDGTSVFLVLFSLFFALIFVLVAIWGVRRLFGSTAWSPPKAQGLASENPIGSVSPVGLYFDNLRYLTQGGKEILSGVSGAVPPGHVLAIMGGSGAGKTTLLDILAAKHKTGSIEGTVRLNAEPLTEESPLRRLVGFVDQSDSTLVPTQTVYEHVLFSALLRLPRSMSRATKEVRVLDTLSELGIAQLRDQLVGKGLSGGERRRVAIACELVTSPSVLLLDEPTSGLDAFNAFSVVETLVNLAKNANRTVVFTIHQPRSNIVSLFDRMLLLAQGQLVFTGTQNEAEDFFASIGYECPPNYNFADYIVDLSMKAALTPYTDSNLAEQPTPVQGLYEDEGTADNTILRDEAGDATAGSGAPVPAVDDVLSDVSGEDLVDTAGNLASRTGVGTGGEADANYDTVDCPDPEIHTRPLDAEDDPAREWRDFNFHREQISRSSAQAMANSQLSLSREGLEPLVSSFKASVYFTELQEMLLQTSRASPGTAQAIDLLENTKRAPFWAQFVFIAQRTFRNLYRDPMLVLTHYGISAGLGVLCGYLYFHVSNDIPGFQNRLGLFFFLLAVFGFSTLTTVSLFGRERLVFLRERANGYYHPLAYYSAKVLLDIVPLRLGPPLLLGLILYPLVGLNFNDGAPIIFLVVLSLFNLSAASIMLLVGILIADFGVATLVGCMVNLFGILFAGLFLNQESMPIGSGWVRLLSIYHYAYEALSVNEVRYLTLTEDKFGLKIEVPGAAILSAFGFNNEAVTRDVFGLAVAAIAGIILGYIALNSVLIERR